MTLKIAITIIFVLIFTGCAGQTTGDITKSRNYTDQLRYQREVALNVTNFNGLITVKAVTGANAVTIDATISASARSNSEAQEFIDSMDVIFQKQADSINVEVMVPRTWTMPGGARRPLDFNVDMIIEVPDGLVIDCKNSNGEILISGPHSDVITMQENGNVTITGTTGRVQATTVNGDIMVRNDQDYNFNIRMITQNGNHTLYLPKAQKGQISIRAVNGNIDIVMPNSYEPDIQIVTNVGDIAMKFGQRLVATVDLKTDTGNISSGDIFLNTNVAGGISEDNHIRGMISSGVGNIRAQTNIGNIDLDYYND